MAIGSIVPTVIAVAFAVWSVMFAISPDDGPRPNTEDGPDNKMAASGTASGIRSDGDGTFQLPQTQLDTELTKTAHKNDPNRGKGGVRMWTEAELRRYNGTDESLPIMLVVMGQVFDVSKGKQHYAPGQGYNIFVGQDASRAFVSGEFDELKEGGHDATGMKESELLGIDDWRKFYNEEKKYTFQGYLFMPNGYYDEAGHPTQKLLDVEKELDKAYATKRRADEYKQIYPSCNSKYEQNKGSWVWCDGNKVPRVGKLSWDAGERCACYEKVFADSMGDQLTVYKDCPPDASKCTLITF